MTVPGEVPSGQRWVLSALDCLAHLLSDLPPGGDGLQARCGAVLPVTSYQHDHQPTGPLACTECVVVDIPGHSPAEASPGRPLSPGEALVRFFMDNADHGRNAANDDLVMALRQRAREIQALAERWSPETVHPQPPDIARK